MSSLADMFSLQGKTALVTGATGGLGLSMCLVLAEAGADIVSIQLPNDKGSSLLEDGVQAQGRKLSVFTADVGDSDVLRATMKHIWAAGHVCDILLNCAGLN